MARELEYTVLCPFGGSGGGALGFLDAEVRLLGAVGRFRCLGSIDFDAVACDDFERFTGSAAWCADVAAITPEEIRARFGERAPDVVFSSPPCKGSSRLLSAKKAQSAKYAAMNELALVWTRTMLAAWPDPPPLVLIENVPGLPTRAAKMLRELRRTLRAAGYVFHASTHDCGEIGGLAQRRKRFLLVARHPEKCPPFLYQPPKRRVRGCGEVLSTLPMPETEAAREWGALHEMPRLTWRNWLRLALIPAGGDWRDLDGVLAEGQPRREVFGKHRVEGWNASVGAVAGPGSNGVCNVADPRLSVSTAYDAGYAVLRWDDPSRTVAGKTAVGCGAYAVADPRERLTAESRVMTLDEALALDLDPSKRPPFVPVIVARDGTWHRPLTLLELALLQSYPARIGGEPIRFAGTRTQAAEHIGNSVPPHAARALGEQMLTALVQSTFETAALSSGPVWVEPSQEATAS